MLGITGIASYLPDSKVSNYDKKDKFKIDDSFIEQKIGVRSFLIKEESDKASDLCVKAFNNLERKKFIDKSKIDCCIVVTQNSDYNIPHTSAIVHSKLNLPNNCACFDISLGCSGYVYGLSNIISFMKNNNLKRGLLFTADPYSEIVDQDDKNTALLFGDAATVTYIGEELVLELKDVLFGTDGSNYKELICDNGKLYMNGRAVFTFTATMIPKHISQLLEKNSYTDKDIDKYILHQGSKYIVDTIGKRLKVDESKIVFDMSDYGNTVSSSIPIILEKELDRSSNRFVISGFGVGLSWASAILERVGKYGE
ncbi:ketoacyl-ACP synthase III [Francisella orientalis]|uniref:Ketoacyl-ACP synthase III n=1 Tax=Francisella orientalis TaxID=299583 RepID=A0AAP6X788_9GAMM|nr:ketoacyl-ACP synthase III [Francisella orientalis]AFJ43283.1 UDP-glucose 4-epimerase [Francisella orientalis str. Toba 04]AHB98783.1 3-oxoacyl-ACP synthase [Francisella orientalis LADL 07-285A]AKN86051.1 UDP-glucose 4-epimerase [Francisella orientalis FNO12]AKN87589.1 UDP-glucose 4-epimerase [Francisella orientalis FNO24]AKN89127.1 UDP-glucose 4-epimerase [Francisella orientalis]